MKNNKSIKWIIVAGVAAVVAVITTLVVLALRARAKRRAWCEEEAVFEYDFDDDACLSDFEEEADLAVEEEVQE
ncbi:MAG: hypothetical protein II363_02700 [Clostridia bacterium]|nr:hypothetical protein [Clostridia bacterium]